MDAQRVIEQWVEALEAERAAHAVTKRRMEEAEKMLEEAEKAAGRYTEPYCPCPACGGGSDA